MATAGFSRRRDMRLGAPRSLRVTLDAARSKAIAHDISMGGLALVTGAPIALRTIMTVRLTFGSIQVDHKVRVQHCRRVKEGWFVGVTFIERPLKGSATVTKLFNAILESAITFS